MHSYLVLTLTAGLYIIHSCQTAKHVCNEELLKVSSQDRRQWPSGIVRYVIDSNFSSKHLDVVHQAIKHVEERTCITFQRHQLDTGSGSSKELPEKSLYIMHGHECSCRVGYKRHGSTLLLHTKCLNRMGTVVHELLHALGLRHDHQRWDRGMFIHINYTNVRFGMAKNFVRRSRCMTYIIGAGLPYDYRSIMHYGKYAFAKDNAWSSVSPLCDCVTIGQRNAMSPADVARVNRLYNCTKSYLGDDILNSVPFNEWNRHMAKLRYKEALCKM